MTKTFFHFVMLGILFFPSAVFAGLSTVVNCSVPDQNVFIGFEYRSNTNILVSSNVQSVELPDTAPSEYSSFRILGLSNASGFVPFVASAGSFQNFTCSPSSISAFGQSFLLGLAGLVSGGFIIYAILSAMQG